MPTVTIPELPVVASVNGAEQIEAVQNGVSVQITVQQIVLLATAVAAGISPTAYMSTNRQMRAALGQQGVLVQIDQAISADVTNTVTIQWQSGNIVAIGDALSAFIQIQLGYSTVQMQALFTLAKTYPL